MCPKMKSGFWYVGLTKVLGQVADTKFGLSKYEDSGKSYMLYLCEVEVKLYTGEHGEYISMWIRDRIVSAHSFARTEK